MRRVAWILLFGACATSVNDGLQQDTDGAYSRIYKTDGDTAYHAAMATLEEQGFSVKYANPLAGSLRANSQPRERLGEVFYRIAEVRIENAPGGTRVRLTLIKTRQPEGSTRRPVRDLAERDRKRYVAFFDALGKRL